MNPSFESRDHDPQSLLRRAEAFRRRQVLRRALRRFEQAFFFGLLAALIVFTVHVALSNFASTSRAASGQEAKESLSEPIGLEPGTLIEARTGTEDRVARTSGRESRAESGFASARSGAVSAPTPVSGTSGPSATAEIGTQLAPEIASALKAAGKWPPAGEREKRSPSVDATSATGSVQSDTVSATNAPEPLDQAGAESVTAPDSREAPVAVGAPPLTGSAQTGRSGIASEGGVGAGARGIARERRIGVLRLSGNHAADVRTVYAEASLVWGLEE